MNHIDRMKQRLRARSFMKFVKTPVSETLLEKKRRNKVISILLDRIGQKLSTDLI